ncbi:hypothetical protein [Ruegeria atlantica]|uniref:hypothetical protein n=1 Tax=Ruegeria atlantica TaxID=81569 RepID=UPI00147D8200|nr:hypothetical protein [Ruegeria atlantica]
MATAYFLTAAILSIWAYTQTRAVARNIRIARGTLPCPLDDPPSTYAGQGISHSVDDPSGKENTRRDERGG